MEFGELVESKYKVGDWVRWQTTFQPVPIISKILGYISWSNKKWGYQVGWKNNSNFLVLPAEVIDTLSDEQAAIWLLEN